MKKEVFKPNGTRVLVLAYPKESKTSGGVILPASVSGAMRGVIITIGDGVQDNPIKFNPGDKVIFSELSGVKIRLNLEGYAEQNFLVMQQLDIMGTFTTIVNN